MHQSLGVHDDFGGYGANASGHIDGGVHQRSVGSTVDRPTGCLA